MKKDRRNDLEVLTERTQCLELRALGKSYPEIASELGLTVSAVYKHVSSALSSLRKKTREKAEEVRELERLRLDKMYAVLSPAIERGVLDHIEVGLKVMARRAKLEGIDSPQEVSGTFTVNHVLHNGQVSDPTMAKDVLRRELGESF